MDNSESDVHKRSTVAWFVRTTLLVWFCHPTSASKPSGNHSASEMPQLKLWKTNRVAKHNLGNVEVYQNQRNVNAQQKFQENFNLAVHEQIKLREMNSPTQTWSLGHVRLVILYGVLLHQSDNLEPQRTKTTGHRPVRFELVHFPGRTGWCFPQRTGYTRSAAANGATARVFAARTCNRSPIAHAALDPGASSCTGAAAARTPT